jgi:hypothetical protein
MVWDNMASILHSSYNKLFYGVGDDLLPLVRLGSNVNSYEKCLIYQLNIYVDNASISRENVS